MKRRHGVGIVLGLGVGVAAVATAQLGPLDPPAGPISDTSPSLAQLEAKIDSLLAAPDGPGGGPWEIFKAPSAGPLNAQNVAILVTDETVYVKCLVAFDLSAALFDGPGGTVSPGGRVESGDWIAWNRAKAVGSGGYRAPVTVPVQQVVTGGLYAAWAEQADPAYLYVLYRVVENTP